MQHKQSAQGYPSVSATVEILYKLGRRDALEGKHDGADSLFLRITNIQGLYADLVRLHERMRDDISFYLERAHANEPPDATVLEPVRERLAETEREIAVIHKALNDARRWADRHRDNPQSRVPVREVHYVDADEIFWSPPSPRGRAIWRVQDTPELTAHADTILANWPGGDRHWVWVIEAPVQEIVAWAERVERGRAFPRKNEELDDPQSTGDRPSRG